MRYWYVLLGLGLLIIFLVIFSFREAKKASIKLDTEQFKQNMRKAQLIDVRNKNEYDAGHINGARNINVATLAREYSKLRKDQPVYLYCQTGKRSNRAAVFLRARGFSEIYELKDGLQSWNGPLK